MSIIDEYNKQLNKKSFQADPEQYYAVQKLEQLQQEISDLILVKKSLTYKFKAFFKRPLPSVSGCYIWGDVGRGKTWLMDMFFESFDSRSLIGERKIRLHFHHFMQAVHDHMSLINDQNKPLEYIAKAFAKRYQLICLDEFHVSDITDAMLLYGLLETLFAEGVILVVTSNQVPDNLYKNGLQRDRFLPAIELLKKQCHIVELDGAVDHRLRLLEKADTWHLLTDDSHNLLEARFKELVTCPAQRNYKVHINYRIIKSILYTDDIIWLDFNVICGDERGSADYIEIARQFHSVFISNIPVMNDGSNDKAKRFINMIDEFYDRNVNLLCSAEARPEQLYTGKQFAFEFKRTISRLLEMRSHEYMQRPHKIS